LKKHPQVRVVDPTDNQEKTLDRKDMSDMLFEVEKSVNAKFGKALLRNPNFKTFSEQNTDYMQQQLATLSFPVSKNNPERNQLDKK
jgi:hypothetical protein